jgi:GNAT superfamily N-acetyltransferase
MRFSLADGGPIRCIRREFVPGILKDMVLQVIEESPRDIEAYATVPIRFVVKSRCLVISPRAGAREISLAEEPVDPPYEYDYDSFDAPASWRQWDLDAWGFLGAFEGTSRVGGAAIAFRTPGLDLLEGRTDLASLWDIRVRPERRGTGIGALLFAAAKTWAREHGAREMRVETQDINAPACRFYAKQGCRLMAANPGVYERLPGQVQLLWSVSLE